MSCVFSGYVSKTKMKKKANDSFVRFTNFVHKWTKWIIDFLSNSDVLICREGAGRGVVSHGCRSVY